MSCTVRGQSAFILRWEMSCTVRGQSAFILRWEMSCTVRGQVSLTADSTRHLSTEDESKGTFSLNCTSASNSVTDYSPWRWPSRVETCRSVLRIKIVCILVHSLVNIIFVWYSARTWNTLNVWLDMKAVSCRIEACVFSQLLQLLKGFKSLNVNIPVNPLKTKRICFI
jgi:hypothetical protein